MNNEFNNQNMNQFQNSNMNSQYSNNYNNLNKQNSNKGSNNGLITILVLIIIALIGLCLFFALDKKDNNVDNNKDNNIQENENNDKDQGNDKFEGLNCIFDGELVQGVEYVNGQYTYRYMQEYSQNDNGITEWINISQIGWGVTLTNKESKQSVTTKLCSSINDKPIVSMSYMFNERKVTEPYGTVTEFPCQATSIDLGSFDTRNVTNMQGMFYLSNVTTLDLSGFDISNVTNVGNMFVGDKLKTVYVKNQEDADKFNTSLGKPFTLKIVVK